MVAYSMFNDIFDGHEAEFTIKNGADISIDDIDGAWTGSETAACTSDTDLCQDYSKHWSEMRAFAMALQFNSMKIISDGILETVYDYLGTAPVFPGEGDVSAYRADLLMARDLLQSAYGFSDATVAGW